MRPSAQLYLIAHGTAEPQP